MLMVHRHLFSGTFATAEASCWYKS